MKNISLSMADGKRMHDLVLPLVKTDEFTGEETDHYIHKFMDCAYSADTLDTCGHFIWTTLGVESYG